jgi:uncharacterized protein YndB with AHSA1/START domain
MGIDLYEETKLMPYVEHAVDIAAPPEAVFSVIAHQPERQPQWWPSFILQERITPPPTTLGSRSRYIYNMMGIRLKGEHEVIDYVEGQRLVVKTISGLDSIFEFTFEPDGEGTRLWVRVNYTLPGSVLGQLLNRLTIESKNERDLADALSNLKLLVEQTVHEA